MARHLRCELGGTNEVVGCEQKKPRSTKGKTWEEIYGPQYAAIKREQVRAIMTGRIVAPETGRKISEGRLAAFRDGRLVNHQKGKPHSEASKRRMSETRRARYGTRASLNKQVRYTSKYRDWRTQVFVRDGYECQECGATSSRERHRVELHAHHKVPLFKLLMGLTFTEAMQNAAVWDISNAVTLCVSCHRRLPVEPYW